MHLLMHACWCQFIPFTENYNLDAAVRIKNEVGMPVIVVGGIRTLESMTSIISNHGMDAISLCRPLICEPDIPIRIKNGTFTRSQCANCNLCTIHCDSKQPTRCHAKKGNLQ
ncbi:MAG: hypothetical protein NT018_03670 [Armatimonadetes bacterium]|nr:hypothetical protein [Armatimonadota bacterium]